MKILFAFLLTLFLALPSWAAEVTMGSGGNLIFEPNEITINAGCLLYTSDAADDC